MLMLKIKRIDPRAPLPRQATQGSAGMDLCAMLDDPLTLEKGSLYSLPTGIAAEIPEGHVGLVFARSGLATKHGITLSNAVGVIDSDYRGEIKVGLCNVCDTPYTIQPLDRIAQLVIVPVPSLSVQEVDHLTQTERGCGGFGSTGKS